ncbi:uncharacterized protein GGS22DRAFT_200326 [Annulohypoxylon maeteangense]|uniref:uncharacterized protein n=1 Tax=Annulohypoxylon maeteangense TaxID=1927788 RepID=UPI002007FCB2|nr:uncharacterized protein GGS22DRAFT_200326 [Annulohypoxylon maeteangense]KAI0884529.1 hypothetical protein GGS22DRAFT_200326 [Annulohypoxylon maeteangense]
MSGYDVSLYAFMSGSDEDYYQQMGLSTLFPSAYNQGNDQTQQQPVVFSDMQGWDNISQYPSHSLHTPGPEANEANTTNTDMSTMFGTDQGMFQQDPNQETYSLICDEYDIGQNSEWDEYFHSAVENSQPHNGLVSPSPIALDESEMRSLFGSPVRQYTPTEVVSPAPLQQLEGQLQQPREEVILPSLTMSLPQEGSQVPSSQESGQSQATTAPTSGQGQKPQAYPEESYPTPESTSGGHESGEPRPRTRKTRIVGKNSCECCRRSKVKCVHAPGMVKCKRCEAKGFDCVVSGIDNRTNKSSRGELHEVINKNHALIQEFVALLYLLSPRGAGSNQEEHAEALRMVNKGWSPTKILEYFDKPASGFFPLDSVRELTNRRAAFEKLEERRTAIREAEEYGKWAMCALYKAYSSVRSGMISDKCVEEILRDAKYGRFTHPALEVSDEERRSILAPAVTEMYMGTPMPSPRTVKALPNYLIV